MTRKEYNCSVSRNGYLLLSELFCAHTFHFNKRAEVNLYVVLLLYFIIGRFLCRRFRLRNQNLANFQCPKILLLKMRSVCGLFSTKMP